MPTELPRPMPTELLPTRTERATGASLARGLPLALALHALVFAGVGLAAWISHRAHPRWGDARPIAGSVQASMVNALPLPPRQRTLEDAVLTSEKPSLAPTPVPAPPKPDPVKPRTEPPPRPEEVPIPKKATRPPKETPRPAEREQPVVAKRPAAAPPVPPTKATTGDTAGVQIPQSTTQLKNGSSTITVEERAFGNRYAYYVRLISQKVNQAWQQAEASPSASNGKRTTITFTIDRDGTPTDPHISIRSGSPTLDSSALRAIQRIDTFGPLPQGDHITIEFSFDFHSS